MNHRLVAARFEPGRRILNDTYVLFSTIKRNSRLLLTLKEAETQSGLEISEVTSAVR